MPLLPKRNTLDYNPNSIVNASKTIKTISLENMKNPILDPDMKTLSTMDAERELDSNLELLEENIKELYLLGNKLQSVAGFEVKIPEWAKRGAGRGGARKKKLPVEIVVEESEEGENLEEKSIGSESTRRRGRPLGSRNQPVGQITSSPMSSIIPTITPRFQDTLVSSTGNSFATPMNDPNDDDPDDDSSYLPSSVGSRSRTYRSSRSGRSIPSEPSNDGSEIATLGEGRGYSRINLIGLLYGIISKINRITFFINSRFKPIFRKLKAKQQGIIKDKIQKGIYDFYKIIFLEPQSTGVMFFGNLENYISQEVDNGDDILQQIKTALDACLLSITVSLNASLQSSDAEIEYSPADNYALRIAGFEGDPSGRMSGRGRKPRMTGCGRNFYGESINNTRDIPTIWRSVQHIPTKYLL